MPDTMISTYRVARALLEAVVAGEPGALEAVQRHLEAHCGSCGRPLFGAQRQRKSGLCEWCDPKYSMPEIATIPEIPGVLAEAPADLTAWQGPLQARLRRAWKQDALQQLIVELAALGIGLPLLKPDGRPAGVEVRRRFYRYSGVMDALVRAARGGVGVRLLAVLLFNASPGQVSDEIAKEIDKADPTARK
ncbi:MAG TPA: hypothetical protein VFS21_14315 [Roseiflexaceae bacterium]|nr:hypothetical protein [Roseiflexaceae bacterium]